MNTRIVSVSFLRLPGIEFFDFHSERRFWRSSRMGALFAEES
jgi:hypothetical protein